MFFEGQELEPFEGGSRMVKFVEGRHLGVAELLDGKTFRLEDDG